MNRIENRCRSLENAKVAYSAQSSRRRARARYSLLAAGLWVASTSHAAVAIEFLDPPSQWSAREGQAKFHVKADGGILSGVQCSMSSLSSERGDPSPRDSFKCDSPPTLEPGKVNDISLALLPTASLRRGSYNATVQVFGTDPSKAVVSKTFAAKVVIPPVSLKVGDTESLRIKMVRKKFWAVASDPVAISLRVTSDERPTKLPTAVRAQLYVQDGENKDLIPDGYLDASLVRGVDCTKATDSGGSSAAHGIKQDPAAAAGRSAADVLAGSLLCVAPSVPSSIQKASAVLRLQSPEFASDIETPIVLLVKDWWPYAAIVVFCGQLLSFFVNNWITVGRQNKLNKLQVAPLESDLLTFLLRRPDLEGNRDVVEIGALLDAAAQANRLGELADAKKSIDSAKQKLDQLVNSPPQPIPMPGGPSIVMLQSNRAYTGRWLNFVMTNPDPSWTTDSMYQWEWSGQRPTLRQAFSSAERKTVPHLTKEYLDRQQWRPLAHGPDLRRLSSPFWKRGQYTLRVTVDSGRPLFASFQLDKDEAGSFLSQIRNVDVMIWFLAVVFAAILSYLTIDKLETFGSVSDYALAFLGGFGLNATTSGFSAVLSHFKGPSA